MLMGIHLPVFPDFLHQIVRSPLRTFSPGDIDLTGTGDQPGHGQKRTLEKTPSGSHILMIIEFCRYFFLRLSFLFRSGFDDLFYEFFIFTVQYLSRLGCQVDYRLQNLSFCTRFPC